MGIQQTKTLLKTYYSKPSPKDPDSYLQKGFCPEALKLTEFLDHFWDSGANEHFDWTNIQENKKFEEIQKEKDKFYLREKYILSELPETKIIYDNIFNIETLAENKEAYNPTETKYFSEYFIKRMNILLFAYVKKIISTLNESSSLDCMAKYFESNNETQSKVLYDMGMNLFVRMLEDQTLVNSNKKLKEETLDFMLNSMIFVRPLNFYGETKDFFMLDKSLDQIVNYLKKIIIDDKEEKNLRIKAYKIMLNLALAKGSLKNLLDFVKYYDYINDFVDLNTEINIFKNEFIKLSLSHPTSTNVICKSKLWNFKISQKKKKDAPEEIKLDAHLSLTSDGSFLYIYSSAGYLIKVGSGYNNTMLGNVYACRENFRVGEKGTIVLIEGVLYYRSTNLDPDPVICLDSESLTDITINYMLNSREPNHLWIEGKKNDFEFPHSSYKEMNELIEKKKNMGAEDKPNQRPTTASPITTDGRYIYIMSKWFDEYDTNLEKVQDDDDDEPKNINKKAIVSIYGVDIYDPLNNMCNIKSVKLNLKKQASSSNLFSEEVTFPDLLANGVVYTNGNIICIGQYKFSLITGEQIESDLSVTIDTIKSACYDLTNNVIWGILHKSESNNQEKLEIICYFNHSAKPIIEYPNNHPKYMPCSLEKIIHLAEEKIKLENLSEKISIKKYQRENTLNILNLEDNDSEQYKKQNLFLEQTQEEKEKITLYKKSVKCLILSTIAKLSEYYGQVPDIRSANTDQERGHIFSIACRRPYCVKLESEIFENLIVFINHFSESFFKIFEKKAKTEIDEKEENEKINEIENELDMLNYLDSYCLLSTIKILRTNLSCLSRSNLDLKFFIKDTNNNPFLKVKEFIFKILEIYNKKIIYFERVKQDLTKLQENEKKNFEIIKALYEECKIILLVSVNTLYPDYNDIIEILETEIVNFKTSNYSKDVVNCILEWMSSEENMKNLLLKLKNNQINKIFEIFKTVSGWEVMNFSNYLKNFKDFSQSIPKFSSSTNDEIIAFKFSSNMQTEILKSISKKLLNENYDDIENELLLKSFSNIIFENVLDIFKDISGFIVNIKNLITKDYYKNKKIEKKDKFIDDEEVIDTCFSTQKEDNNSINKTTEKHISKEECKIADNISLEEYLKSKIKDIWNFIMDKIICNNLLIIKIFNFHIDSLSILTSNFVISSLMLNSFNNLISELNKIYKLIKELEAENKTIETEKSDYKELIFESDHPYRNNETKWFTIDIPGEKELFIEFDPLCDLKPNCAYVNFYTDRTMSLYAFPSHVLLNTNNFPKEPIHCTNSPIELYYNSDSCANTSSLWGFRIKVHNGNKKSTVITNDQFSNLMRRVCWVSSKCSAQLLRANFTKPVSSSNEEDDLKYNNLLNSKLFAGGLDFEEIRKENDQNISNVLNILEDLIPETSHEIEAPQELTEKSLLMNILNGDNENVNRLLSAIQKKFSEETVWAHIGGQKADRLVRAAFAALLRHSGQAHDFNELLDLVEFSEEIVEERDTVENIIGLGNNDKILKKNSNFGKNANSNNTNTLNLTLTPNLINSVHYHSKFNSIYKKWQAASRMRTWLVEKKKNVDEALEKSKPTVTSKKDDNNTSIGNTIDSANTFTNYNDNKNTSLNQSNNNSGNANSIAISNNNINTDVKNEDNNSEEIMNKIIEQTVIKAKFLIKLNPSPAFVENLEDLKPKTNHSSILIRSSSLEINSNGSADDSWKTRLNQWKLLQKSKKIIRSVEEEANEKLTSLTSSVLLTLQSTISSKRLFNKIKIATIKAKAREIGLITLKNIFEETSHSSLIKDLLSWFCASLRKTDNKICHYLDNISGCGRHFEFRIEESFHNFIILLIQKLICIDDTIELKSFVDALMWRYSTADHKFLVEQSVFLILWGTYNANMKNAWGKPLKPTIELPNGKEIKTPNFEFTKDIIELFEILSNICIEKATISQWEKQKQADKNNLTTAANSAPNKAPVNIKFPNLERTISSIDDNSSESLITHILDVIFGEASNAINSYMKFRGISYKLWQQYELYEEEKLDEKKKKKKTTNNGAENQERTRRSVRRGRGRRVVYENSLDSFEEQPDYSNEEEEAGSDDSVSRSGNEDDDMQNNVVNTDNLVAEDVEVSVLNNINNVDNKDENSKKKKEEEKNQEEKPYFYEHEDKINLYDELRLEESGKGYIASNSKTNITVNELLTLVFNQNEVIYDPNFLNRLLIVLYKCSTQYQNEKILFNIANPLSFSILFKLIRICSTPEKILIAKILFNLSPHIPEEILIEGIDLFLKDSENDVFIKEFSLKREKYGNFDKNIFIEFIIELITDLRIKCWIRENDSSGAYIVTSHLIQLLRILWLNENWKILINNLFNDLINFEELNLKYSELEEKEKILSLKKILRKEIILGIFGGEHYGLAIGAEIKVKNEFSQNSIDLDFIKKDFSDHYNSGTILGFGPSIDELWHKKITKENKNDKKNKKSNPVYLTPNNNVDSQVCVLLQDSILKDEFNLIDITPKFYNQHEIIVRKQKINFENLTISAKDLEKILIFITDSYSENKESICAIINLRSDYLRFLDLLFKSSKGLSLLAEIDLNIISKIFTKISEISNQKIVNANNFLNLELLEEKRFRIINYCLENKASLNELEEITASFKKPNNLIVRINKDYFINIAYQVINVSNFQLLGKLNEFRALGIENKLIVDHQKKENKKQYDSEKFEFVLCNFENIEYYLNEYKKVLIITNNPSEVKFSESKYKKYENSAIVILDNQSFEEIVNVYNDLVVNKRKVGEIPSLNKIITINKIEENKVTINNLENEKDISSLQVANVENNFEKDLIESTIRELEEFGFDPELIKTEIIKMKDNFNLNDLITNLIEYKDKAKEKSDENNLENFELNDDPNSVFIGNFDVPLPPSKDNNSTTEKKKENNEDELDDENKNDCFNTKEEEKKSVTPDFFEELIIPEKADNYLIYNLFKTINEKISILYLRRILISIVIKLVQQLEENSQNEKNLNNNCDKEKAENILTLIPEEYFLKNLKLLTNEGLFSNSINYGSDLLLQIKESLIKLFSNNKHKKVLEITDRLTKDTYRDLEKILSGKIEHYDFVTNNEDSILKKPVLFFSIWNLMIMNEYSKNKPEYNYIFNILSGVVLKIKDNKQIRWFLLDLLIQFINRIFINIKSDLELARNLTNEKSFKCIENINKLRIFLDESIAKESKKSLSKRSQMICELLINLEELESKLKSVTGKKEDNNILNLLEANIKKDNFIVDLLTTFEMMKDFFEKPYLKYLAWTEMNPEIINSSKLVFESAHLYPKAPHTILINIPNSISLDVNIFSDTLLDNGDAIVYSLDKNGNFPLECYVNRSSKKQFSIHSSHVFVHFPSNYLNEVYSFGSNGSNRLGHSGTEVYNPKLIDSLSSYIIKDICIGDTYVLVLTNNGELFACGSGLGSGLKQNSNTFVKSVNILNPDKINSQGISFIGVNQGSTIISTKDYSYFSIGPNGNGQLGQGWTSPVNDITSMNFVKKIKQISISDTHTMMVSLEGQIYHTGNNDYYQSGEYNTTRNNTPKLVDLGKEFICECLSAGEYFTIFVMKNILTKKSKLYSSGYNKNGRNGIGKDDDSYQVFKIVPCFENENIEFKFCTSSKTSSAAISTTGKLYTWGLNTKGSLGFGHFNNVLEPTQVTYFDKYEVFEASMSVEHMLVLVKDAEKNKISVFGCGDYSNGMLGETITQKTEKKDCISTPIKISFFEGKNPYKIVTGPRASIVMCKIKPYEEIRDTHNNSIECALCSKRPIIGNLYAEIFNAPETNSAQTSFVNENEIKFYCTQCEKINELSSKSPRLLIKAPLRDYGVFKEFIKKPNLLPKYEVPNSPNNTITNSEKPEEINCKNCKEPINYAVEGCYQYQENKAIYALCNNCIDFYPSCITSAKIYLRTFTKFKTIDITNVNLYYDNSISYGHKFSITPVLNEKGSEAIIEKNIISYSSFLEEINDFNKFEIYEQLVDLLNNYAQKSEKSIFTYQPKDLSFKKEELSVRSSLEKSSPDVLRKMFVILKILNTRVKDLLPFIDFSKVLQDNQRLSYHFNKITPLIFWETKFELIKSYLEKTCADYECGEVKVNRMKTRRFIEKGKPDHTGEFTVFGQIIQYLKTKTFKIFKKKEGGNNNKMFNVTFVGEASIDAGGPYREALTQACSELQSSALPLFIPSPNQKNESGLFREKWIINPSAKSTTHLEMFKYFGGLIGYAMRTGEFLNLDLPSIFWKKLLEANVDRKDLELIDRYTIQCLDDIINIHKKGVSEKNFNFIVDQKFTTCLSDGTEVELVEDGRNIDVTFANRNKYCELVEKIRMEESKVQIAAIRGGLE